jgi:hypothetical protein
MFLTDRRRYRSPVVQLFSVCAGRFGTNLRRIRIMVIMFAGSACSIIGMGSLGCKNRPYREAVRRPRLPADLPNPAWLVSQQKKRSVTNNVLAARFSNLRLYAEQRGQGTAHLASPRRALLDLDDIGMARRGRRTPAGMTDRRPCRGRSRPRHRSRPAPVERHFDASEASRPERPLRPCCFSRQRLPA